MEKLKLKHLSAYLPYNLRIGFEADDCSYELIGLGIEVEGVKVMADNGDFGYARYEYAKPILRPLSDLTKEIEHNGHKFCPINLMNECSGLEIVPSVLSNEIDDTYLTAQEEEILISDFLNNHYFKLLEWHFDVFGLIDKGLAVNINKLKSK